MAAILLAFVGGKLIAYTGFVIAQNVAKYFMQTKTYTDQKITRNQLKAGDHIYVPGSSSASAKMSTGSSLYYHHGVYLGNNEVADFGAVNHAYPVIRSLDSFLGDTGADKLTRRTYTGQVAPEDTIKYARYVCSLRQYYPYNLLDNNCEHFATLLKIKRPTSEQTKHIPQEPIRQNFYFGKYNHWDTPK